MRFRGAARGRRSREGATRGRAANSRAGARQHHLSVAPGRCRRGRGRLQIGQARDQARYPQQPASAECDGAARRDRRIRCRQRQLHLVEHEPEPACGAAGHLGLRRRGAGAQIARGRARCGRRLRLQDFHLSGRGGGAVGLQARGPPGAMGRRPQRGLPVRRPRPRSRHACRDRLRRGRQDRGPQGQDHRQSRRLYVDLLVVGSDLPLCDAAFGSVRHPGHLLRGRRGLHQHGAGRCLSGGRSAGGDVRGGAPHRGRGARARYRAGGVAGQELHQALSASDPGDHDVRRRRLPGLARQGAGDRGHQGLRDSQAPIRTPRPAVFYGFSTYGGASVHRAEPGRRLARLRRPDCGNPPRCG